MLYEVITLPVYGKGENIRDWLWVEDHARAIDVIFHQGTVGETYNIGGHNEWTNIDLIKFVITSYSIHYTKLYEGIKETLSFLNSR